jgi:dihydrodipicolinate synthase/N-acetylneuraminate lyase
MITPFDEQRNLDEDAIAVHVDRLASANLGNALGTESPGEGHSLSLAETERFYGVVKDRAAGRVPVVAMGCEPRNAKDYLQLVAVAESVGVDSMQLYSVDYGHGNLPVDKELEAYFRTLLEGTSIPARLSSHFSVGYNIPLRVLERLLDDYDHIVAVHAISRDLKYLRAVIEMCEGRADVLVGGPDQVLPALALGGQGFLDSTCALLMPRTSRAIIDNYERGDMAAMHAAYEKVFAVSMINRWIGPRTVKEAVSIVGLPGGYLRPPYMALDEDERRLMADILKAAEIPETEGLNW